MGDGPGDKRCSGDLVDIGGLLPSTSRIVSSTATECILFNSKILLQIGGDPEESLEQERHSFDRKKKQIREYLSKPDLPKSMGPNRMHPCVLGKLPDVFERSLSIIFE